MPRRILRALRKKKPFNIKPKNNSKDLTIHEYHLSFTNRVLASVDQFMYPVDDFRYYRALWRGIEGWLTEKEAHWLFNQAKEISIKGDIVEIGSAWGRSTICLGWGVRLAGQGKVYGVDPHIGGKGFREQLGEAKEKFSSFDGFINNIKRFELDLYVTPVVATSEDALKQWQGSGIRLLFVDGWHTYDAVQHDILGWKKYVVSGGVIAVHDYATSEEVHCAVHDSVAALGVAETDLKHIGANLVFFQLP